MTKTQAYRIAAVGAMLLLLALAGPASFAAPGAQGRLDAREFRVYLPLIRAGRPLPDLVVTRLELMPASPSAGRPVMAQLTIRNAGAEGTAVAFWVDLYVDPARPPEVNQPWPELSRLGAAWRVPPLAPGETRLLYTGATGDPDRPGEPYANFRAFDTSGEHRLYVLVDSYAPGRARGAVAESDEANNSYGPFAVIVDGAATLRGAVQPKE